MPDWIVILLTWQEQVQQVQQVQQEQQVRQVRQELRVRQEQQW